MVDPANGRKIRFTLKTPPAHPLFSGSRSAPMVHRPDLR